MTNRLVRVTVTDDDGTVIEQYRGTTDLDVLDECMNRLGLDMAGRFEDDED